MWWRQRFELGEAGGPPTCLEGVMVTGGAGHGATGLRRMGPQAFPFRHERFQAISHDRLCRRQGSGPDTPPYPESDQQGQKSTAHALAYRLSYYSSRQSNPSAEQSGEGPK